MKSVEEFRDEVEKVFGVLADSGPEFECDPQAYVKDKNIPFSKGVVELTYDIAAGKAPKFLKKSSDQKDQEVREKNPRVLNELERIQKILKIRDEDKLHAIAERKKEYEQFLVYVEEWIREWAS